ncbi:MAG: hypothetical protein EXS05_06890 [Planctomycetaceae bacterium]|nr:hypothetical protein [Planctomycetaceae bacterium]
MSRIIDCRRNHRIAEWFRPVLILALFAALLGFGYRASAADESKKEAEQAAAEAAKEDAAKAKEEAAREKETAIEKEKEKDAGAETEKPRKDKDAKKPDAPRNPLTDLIKRTLKPGNAANGAMPGVAMPNTPDGKSKRNPDRHSADPRAPYDRKASDWLHKASGLAKANQWKEALELLQRVTDQPEDSLYRTESGKWVSIRSEADRLRGEAPPAVLADYRTQFGGLARQLLQEAIRTGNLAAYGKVAKGYFHTDAGYEAANRLGSLHLDRGEFALSAYWFAALWQARAAVTGDPAWRIKAAYALKQAGQAELSNEIVPVEVAGANNPDSKGLDSVEVGGLRRQASKWLADAALLAGPAESPLGDWLMFLGTPRRNGIAAGGEPLLLPRWRLPLTASQPVQTQIEQLVEDLGDQSAFMPTMLFPTMVDGKIAFRTLHGVQVVDASTGRTLWETESQQPLEKMISGNTGQVELGGEGLIFQRQMVVRMAAAMDGGGMYAGGAGEFSPLCNLLYRNASFGIVASDGRQLFVVDDPAFLTNLQPGDNSFQWDGSRAQLAVPGSKLSSYELATGRPLWEVGGPAFGEPFDPRLAGYFFFGAPIVDGSDLFAIGESTSGDKIGQIRLLALDPQTGAEKWSQLIAYSDPAAIEKDIRRRLWGAPIAADAGILICPTTVGWLVAVDRVTHSLLWGYRPQTPGNNPNRMSNMSTEQHEQQAMVQNTPLAGSWSAAPPILAQGKVIYAALETQTLVCLDQFTGKELWIKPRNTGMYVAGVFDGKVLVIGREAALAFDLVSGATLWTVKTPIPSGRGVAIAGRYELPLSTGEIWSLNLGDGQIVGRSYLPPNVASVGNLAMYRGMLLSLDAFGLTAFEQRDAVRELVEARKRANPGDPWALLREAEISALAHDYPAALASLRQLAPERTPPDLAERRRVLLIEAVRAVIRADLSRPETDADMHELRQVVQSPEEQRQYRRLETDLFVHRHEFAKAFDAYLELAASDSDNLVLRDDTPETSVRGRLWVAGKLADLFAALPADTRAPFEARVAELAAVALTQPAADQESFLELFPGNPAALAVRRNLIELFAKNGELVRSEHLLLELARSPDPAIAASAVERMARLLVEFDLPTDAAQQYSILERQYPNVLLAHDRTAAQSVQALRDSGKLPIAGSPVADWQATGVRVERMGANYVQYIPQELLLGGSSSPFFAQQHFEFEPAGQRLEMIDGASDELRWSLPLRYQAASADGGTIVGRASGHLLSILHRGVVHCLSPVERRVLWTRPLDARVANLGYSNRNINPLQPMQASINLASRQMYQQNMGGGSGPLAIANDAYVCCQGRRNITVFDARTGDPRWTYTGIRSGSIIFGGRDVIYVRPADGQSGLALRAADGKRLELANLNDTLAKAVHSVGDRFVLSSTNGGKTALRLFDPLTQSDLWKVELTKEAVMSPLENDRLAILEKIPEGGRFELLDLQTGAMQILGTLTPEEMKGRNELFALSDNQNVYLLVNKGMNQNFWSEQVPFVRANGTVFAFDPQQSKLRWKQQVAGQNLMLERLDYAPLLVFASRKYEQKEKLSYWMLHLVVIDKLSGAKLLDEKSASQPGFRSVTVSIAERFIELRGWSDRVRLYPIEKSATAGESGG